MLGAFKGATADLQRFQRDAILAAAHHRQPEEEAGDEEVAADHDQRRLLGLKMASDVIPECGLEEAEGGQQEGQGHDRAGDLHRNSLGAPAPAQALRLRGDLRQVNRAREGAQAQRSTREVRKPTAPAMTTATSGCSLMKPDTVSA